MKRVIDINLDLMNSSLSGNEPVETARVFWATDVGTSHLRFTTENEVEGGTASVVLKNLTDGSSVQKSISIASKTFSYVLGEEIEHAGDWIGQVIIEKESKKITGRGFRFQIKGGILESSPPAFSDVENYNKFYEQLTSLEAEFNQYLEDAKIAETKRAKEYTDKLNTAIIASDISTKLTALETQYAPKLTEVTAQLAQNAKVRSQGDYVNLIKNLTNYPYMVFRKDGATDYSVFLHNGVRHISYNIMKDLNDDMMKIGQCYSGAIVYSAYGAGIANKMGSGWVSSGETHYTTVVGDKFTAKVKGSLIKFRAYKDNRGGIWEIVIDKDPAKTFTISTWETNARQVDVELIKGLDPTKEYSIEATFKGADPNNVPSGGTARGWIFYPSTHTVTNATITGHVEFNNNEVNLLQRHSNKEFAFSITKNGETQWVPEHEAPTAFKLHEPKFLIDGIEKNISTMTDKEVIHCQDVKLIQNLYAKLPTVAENIAEIKLTLHIDKGGILNVAGKWKTLQTARINAGYPIMLPADGTKFNEALTSFGNSKVSVADESNYYFTEEKDDCYSVALVSSSNPNLIVASAVDYPLKTLRIGQDKKDLSTALRFWQRAETPKMYFTSHDVGNLSVGETFIWHGRIAVAEIEDIYEYVKE